MRIVKKWKRTIANWKSWRWSVCQKTTIEVFAGLYKFLQELSRLAGLHIDFYKN